MLPELQQRLNRKKNNARLITRIIIAVVLIVAIFHTAGQIAITSTDNQAESAQQSITVPSDTDGTTADGSSNNIPKVAPIILEWGGNIAGILAVAIMTSGGLYLYYRKKIEHIEPLPILFSEEETR
jgi:amino acid transporter